MSTSIQFRRIVLFSILSIKVIITSAQSFSSQSVGIATSDYGANYPSAIWGDYDNDNDIDLARFGPGSATRINRNDLTTFVGSVQTLSVQNSGNNFSGGVWADMNNDGFLDLLFTSNGAATNPIYKNNGDGTFTLVSGNPLGSASYGNLDVADVDADGDLDVLIVGYGWSGLYSGNGPRIFINQGNFTFVAAPYTTPNLLENVYGSASQGAMARFADFTNDGLPDIVISNNLQDGSGGSSSLIAGSTRTQVYANNGNGFTKIFEAALTQSVVAARIDVGDVNYDGWIDFVITGGVDAAWSSTGLVFKNQSGTGFVATTFPGRTDGSVALGDVDNDGDLDLNVLGGPSVGNVIYANDGTGAFSGTSYISGTPPSGLTNGTSVFGDYDNDGRLDLFSIGKYSSTAYCYLLKNPVTPGNSAPNYPTTLTANVNGANVDFSWSAPTDDHTPSNTLSYNIMVGTSTGGMQIVTPHSNPSNGYRRIPKMGNAYLNKFFKLKNMKPGTYYWAVQAIDNGFRGSSFTVGTSFVIVPPPPDVADISYCKYDPAVPLTATPMPGGTLNWWANATGGTVLSAAPTPDVSTAGTTSYWVSQVVNGIEGPRAKIVVTVNSAPSNPGVTTPINYCVGQTSTILTATGAGSMNWYTVATGGTPLSGAPTPSTAAPATLNYWVSQVVTGCESTRSPIVVNVYAIPAAPIVTTPVSLCQGGSSSPLNAVGGTINWWGTLATGGTSSGTPPSPPTTTTGSTTYYVTQTVNGCESIPRTPIIVNVNPVTTITTQPTDVTQCAGGATTFAIGATGAGLAYQWQVSTNGGSTYTNITNGGTYSGATSAILNLSNLNAGLSGYFYNCIVTGVCGTQTSNGARLTVNSLPSIVTQPVSSSICSGANTSFSVTALGTSLSYSWQISTNGGASYVGLSDGGIYSGSTTSTLTLTNVTPGYTGGYYRCTVAGVCTPSAVTTPGILTVNTLPTINTQPNPATNCAGATSLFSVAASGTGLSYQWQVSTNGGSTYTNLSNGGVYSNVTTTTMTISGLTFGMDGYFYRCIVNGVCTPSVTSSGAKLTVNDLPAIGSQPTAQTICNGGNTSFSISATGTALVYQWQFSADGGTNYFNVTNNAIFSNATTPTLSITGINTTYNNYLYRCSVSGTCAPSVNSTGVLLTVNSLPSIVTQPTSASVCAGSNTSFSVSATGTGLYYQWMISNDGGITYTSVSNGGVYSNTTAPTLNITGATAGLNGKPYQCIVNGTCNVPVVSSNAVLTVNNLPVVNTQPVNSTICTNGSTTFSVTASGTGIGYKWEVSTDNGSTFSTVSNGGVYSNATTSSLTITTPTTVYNNNHYRCQVYGTCGPADFSNHVILTVNALPVISGQPTAQSICSGGNTTFNVGATGTGLNYQWQISTNGGSTYSNLSNGGVYSNATSSALQLTGVTTALNNNYYRCVVNGTCVSPQTSNGAILTVNSSPLVTTQPTSTNVCPFTDVTFTAAGTGSGITYTWQYSPDGVVAYADLTNGGGYSNVNTAALLITGPSTTLNGYNYRCKISGVCTPVVYSNPAVLSFNAAPIISTQPVPVSICGGGNTSFSVTASGVTSYKWQESSNGSTYSDISNGGIFSNATTASLTITGATTGKNGFYYRCVASGSCTPAATSNAVTLTVGTLPSITSQPTAQTVCVGDFATFSVLGSGGGITYQWQQSVDGATFTNLTNGGGVIGALTSDLGISANVSHNGKYYRCVASGSCNPPATSSAVVLTVNSLPSITVQPVPASVCLGADTTFKITATGSGLNYQWQVSTNGGSVFNDISNGGPYSNVTATTLKISGATMGLNNGLYRCVVGGSCSTPVNSNSTLLTVNSLPTVTSSLSGYACSDLAQNYLIGGAPLGTTFSWSRAPVLGISNPSVSNVTSGTIAEALTNTTTGPVNVTYVITPKFNGCVGVNYNYVVAVNTVPNAPVVTSGISYCKGATASPLSATPDAGGSLLWYDIKQTGGVSSTVPTIPSTVNLGTTNYYVSQSLNGCESSRSVIAVTVNGSVAAPAVTVPNPYCQGAVASPLDAIPDIGATLNWYGTNATGGTASTVAPVPSTAVAGVQNYYVSQIANSCESPRVSIAVTTNAIPSGPTVTGTVSYCQNASPVALTATPSASGTINWYGTTATGGVASSTASVPVTSSVGSVNYYVSQTVNSCESPRSLIVVTTLSSIPTPDVPTGISYCQNEVAVSLTATTSGNGVLRWYGTNATGGTGSSIAPLPLTSVSGTTLYYVSQKENGCESSRAPISVLVNAKPTVLAGPDKTVMEFDPVTLSGSGTATSYTWNNGVTNGVSFSPDMAASGYYVVTGTLGSCLSKDSMVLIVRRADLPEIGVYYSGQQIFSNKDEVNIGNETVNQGPFRYTFTINNQGFANLNVNNLVLTGANNSSFSIVQSNLKNVLKPDSSTSFDIVFMPLDTGVVSARITILNDDQDESNYIINVKGYAKRISPTISFASISDKEYGSSEFELIAVASNGKTISFTSSNTSLLTINGNLATPLELGDITISASIPGDANYEPVKVDRSFKIKLPTFGLLGSDFLAHNIINAYLVFPYRDYFTYKWTYSGDNVTFTSDTLGSQILVYASSNTTNGEMKCLVYNSSGDLLAEVSKPILINHSKSEAYSLAPVTCSPSVADGSECYIKEFALENLKSESSYNPTGITDFTQSNITTDLFLGENYSGKMKVNGISGNKAVGVWIDFNNNGEFDQDEYVFGDIKSDSLVDLPNIRIPNTEENIGSRRLRIKVREADAFTYGQSCIEDTDKGEAEDYIVNLKSRLDVKGAELMTPNGDGKNDCFIIRGINPKSEVRNLQVFDVLGNVIYSDDFYENDWCGIATEGMGKGKLLPIGTYYYVFQTEGITVKSFVEVTY